MGREIRRVPQNWKHPTTNVGDEESYIPYRDGCKYDELAKEWVKQFKLWEIHGNRFDYDEYEDYYFNLESPPLREDFTKVKEEECTWFQYYENISEGTPVSPAFETKDELLKYLDSHDSD